MPVRPEVSNWAVMNIYSHLKVTAGSGLDALKESSTQQGYGERPQSTAGTASGGKTHLLYVYRRPS